MLRPGITATAAAALFWLAGALAGTAAAQEPPPECEAVFPTPMAAHDPDSTLAFYGAALRGAGDEPLVARNLIERNWFSQSCGDRPCEITGTPSETVELPAFADTDARQRLRVRPFRSRTHTGDARAFRHVDVGFLGELVMAPADEHWRIQRLRVGPGATLTLPPGDYWIEDLRLSPSATLAVDGPGTARLFVHNDFGAGPRARLNPGDDDGALQLVGYGDLALGPAASATGRFYAHGDIRLGPGARARGELAGNRVVLGFGARVDVRDEARRDAPDPGDFCRDELPPPVIELDGDEPDTTGGASYPLSGVVTPGAPDNPVVDVSLTGGDLDAPRQVELDDQGRFSESVPLVWGENRLRVTAVDEADRQAEAVRTVDRFDPDPPELTLDNPAEEIVSTATVTVSGRARDAASGVASITLRGGADGPVGTGPDGDGFFSVDIPLAVGEQTLTVTVLDHYGNETIESIRVTRTEPPQLEVDNPATATVTDNSVEVTGTATDDLELAEVVVRNARYGTAFSATLDDDGTFRATVPLRLDDNPLTVVARDIVDNTTERAITVTRLSPPELGQLSPADGAMLHTEQVTLAGRIATELPIERLRLTVNGSRVMVGTDDAPGHPFQVSGMPLRWGGNHFRLRVDSPHGADQRALELSRLPADDDDVPDPEITLLTPADGEWVRDDSVAVAGRVTAHAGRAAVRVNGREVQVSGAAGQFDTRVSFPEAAETLTIQAVASDALGRQSTAGATVHRDAEAPVIRLDQALAPAPQDNPVRESPYRLSGTVTDERLAGMLIDGAPVTLEATAEAGVYRFDRRIGLTAGERSVSLEAFDDAGNRTREHYLLHLDSDALLTAVLPHPGSVFRVTDGEPPKASVVARLDGEAPGASAVALLGNREFSLSLDGGLIEGTALLPVEAGEYHLRIEVSHPDTGLVAATQVPLTVRDPASEPLRLLRITPDPDAGSIGPNRALVLHFNRAVEPEKVEMDVLETLHGPVYRNADPPGADFLQAEGYQLETVHRDREPVPGALESAAGGRALTFTPARFYGHGARLQVEVRHEGKDLSRRQLRVEPLPTQVAGSVTDASGRPAADLPVALGGLRTRTDEHGSFAFGFGEQAGEVPSGNLTLVLNPEREDPRYGTGRKPVSVAGGRFTALEPARVFLINEATGFTSLRGGRASRLADDQLEIDLTDATLRGPDGRGRVSVNPRMLDFTRLGLDSRGPAPGFGVYILQPQGLRVSGPVSLEIAVPPLDGARDWLEPGVPLVVMGLNEARTALVPVGVGRVDGEAVVLERTHWRGDWLDYLALALPPETALDALEAWLDGEGSWSAVRRALGG